MTYRDGKKALRELNAVAMGQGGYFTFRQARDLGYRTPHIHYHISAGNFEKAGHGIYRLPLVPISEHDDLIRLSLWSRNDLGEPQAVVSHESAAFIHELGEVIPSKVHLTVPKRFRKVTPKGCILHKSEFGRREVEEREGFKITSPLRTIIDLADSPFGQEQLEKAVKDCLQKGLVTKTELMNVVSSPKANARLLSISELAKYRRRKVQ